MKQIDALLTERDRLRTERDALHEQLAKANDEVVSLLWAESNNEAERDRLRQALERVLAECKEPRSGDIHAEPWIPNELADEIREALGAKEDR